MICLFSGIGNCRIDLTSQIGLNDSKSSNELFLLFIKLPVYQFLDFIAIRSIKIIV